MYRAGKRLKHIHMLRRTPIILHFGDHDPSGIDMTRDIEDRLEMFAKWGVTVERIALTMDQIDQYDPPPNPAKTTDSRFEAYLDEYGEDSWELDALEPSVLADLIREHVGYYRDDELWDAAVAKESNQREQLATVRDNFDSEDGA